MPNDTTHTPTGIDWEKEPAPQSVWEAIESGGIKEILQAVGDWGYNTALSRRPSGDGSFFRGHRIVEKDGEWFYADNGDSVKDTWRDRPCGICGLPNTPEGHDGCIGTIPGAINACCGHGFLDEAYVQFPSGDEVWEKELEAAVGRNWCDDCGAYDDDCGCNPSINERKIASVRRALSASNSKGGGTLPVDRIRQAVLRDCEQMFGWTEEEAWYQLPRLFALLDPFTPSDSDNNTEEA